MEQFSVEKSVAAFGHVCFEGAGASPTVLFTNVQHFLRKTLFSVGIFVIMCVRTYARVYMHFCSFNVPDFVSEHFLLLERFPAQMLQCPIYMLAGFKV